MARFKFPVSGKKIISLGLKYGGEFAPAPFGPALKLVNKFAGPMLEEQGTAAGEEVDLEDEGGDEEEEE